MNNLAEKAMENTQTVEDTALRCDIFQTTVNQAAVCRNINSDEYSKKVTLY